MCLKVMKLIKKTHHIKITFQSHHVYDIIENFISKYDLTMVIDMVYRYT